MNRLMLILLLTCTLLSTQTGFAKQKIHALYIPLADHYAAIIAYEKYRAEMQHTEFTIEKMSSWPKLRKKFGEDSTEMAFVMSPLAMDMFLEKPNFRWVSLIHRNGNALAVNENFLQYVTLKEHRIDRKPTADIANAISQARSRINKPLQTGVPSLLSTHSVVLYKFLKDHGKTLAVGKKGGDTQDVRIIQVAPPKSPTFLLSQEGRDLPASFEQSLPWADVVETGGYGKVAWYSKDVLKWPNGHVECIVLAKDDAIKNKEAAIKELTYYIHKAGQDIRKAQLAGGKQLEEIAVLVRKHIPEHNKEAIIQSLDKDLDVISYINLNIDKPGLRQVMDLAVEAGILKSSVDIGKFAEEKFSTEITNQ